MNKQVYLEYLVLNSQQGDNKALEELIDYWQPRLLKHAWYLTNDQEVAKDIVQDSWIAAMKGLRSLRDPSRFRAWIYKVITYKCADWSRQNQRQKKLQKEMPHTMLDHTSESDSNDDFYSVLNTLDTKYKTILSLYYLEEMSIAEVAEILKISQGTVKSRLYHARNKLKQKLGEKVDGQFR